MPSVFNKIVILPTSTMCPGPRARNWQEPNGKQHSHRHGHAKTFNAGLLEKAKKAQQQGRKLSQTFPSNNDLCPDNSLS